MRFMFVIIVVCTQDPDVAEEKTLVDNTDPHDSKYAVIIKNLAKVCRYT